MQTATRAQAFYTSDLFHDSLAFFSVVDLVHVLTPSSSKKTSLASLNLPVGDAARAFIYKTMQG